MSQTLRGSILWRIIRRHASTGTPLKEKPKTPITKKIPRPSQPPPPGRPQGPEPKLKSPRTETHGTPSEPSQDGYFHTFLHHSKYRIHRRLILSSPVLILAWLHRPYELMHASGQSMSPFLNPKSPDGLPTTDDILVQRWHRAQGNRDSKGRKEPGATDDTGVDFKRGQIVVFSTPHHPEKMAVKRIVAIPGDVVHPLPGYEEGEDSVVIPWNHVWVEGDIGNRKESWDSNWYGPISQNLILGEVKAVVTSWWKLKWSWIDWTEHTWPARDKDRVEENAIMEAAVDPDAVNYSSGWRNGSIALVLERMKSQPEQVLYAFVNDNKIRQETRRLYNNALYVASVATSEQEKTLAHDLVKEMEDIYGREALVYGIRMKRRFRDRGELPDAGNSRIGEKVQTEQDATEAEKWLRKQGWELERSADGTVKTR